MSISNFPLQLRLPRIDHQVSLRLYFTYRLLTLWCLEAEIIEIFSLHLSYQYNIRVKVYKNFFFQIKTSIIALFFLRAHPCIEKAPQHSLLLALPHLPKRSGSGNQWQAAPLTRVVWSLASGCRRQGNMIRVNDVTPHRVSLLAWSWLWWVYIREEKPMKGLLCKLQPVVYCPFSNQQGWYCDVFLHFQVAGDMKGKFT